MELNNTDKKYHWFLLAVFLGFLGWSMINPYDWTIWAMEVAPAVIGAVILLRTYKKFPMTSLSYTLICFFAIILIIGGHYSYARMPLFEYFKDPPFNAARNHYDRFGHFFQGVMPAIATRELLIRTTPLKLGKWMFWLVLSVALAISACYEIIEWGVGVAGNEDAMDFVGSQGDIFDAQKDMLMCLLGAIAVQLCCNKWQTKQIIKLTGREDL